MFPHSNVPARELLLKHALQVELPGMQWIGWTCLHSAHQCKSPSESTVSVSGIGEFEVLTMQLLVSDCSDNGLYNDADTWEQVQRW